MQNNNRDHHNYRSVSHNFKITMVILLFTLTSVRLFFLSFFPSLVEIVPDKVLLFIVLFIIIYLWFQELRDYYNLLRLNQNLQVANEQLKQAEVDTIASLVKTEEAKDIYTSGHSERVTHISLAIADEMRLDSEKKKILARAGVLHDIGKIGISDSILCKREKLTDEEWAVIRSHPETAIKILEPLKFLSTERNVILSHHERYDGTGYPRGIKGDKICIEALILAVADAFDAMNSKRYYRESLTKDAIIAELTRVRGTQHSPKVVDAFFALLKKDPRLWEK